MQEAPEARQALGAPDAPNAPEEPAVAPRARRRGRTVLLVATAAVLGAVAGTCTGYLIQADREPTRLPSLSQPALARAKGPAPEPLSAAQDRRVRTDGDLRKLLLPTPRGAKDAEWLQDGDGWMSMTEYASYFERPDEGFEGLISDEFRRAAVTGWQVGDGYVVEVRLIQFRQEEQAAASVRAEDARYWREEERGTRSWLIPGTETGRVYVHSRPTADGETPYGAEAIAWRGDILMELWVSSATPVSKATITDLARRQMERL
ncbi:hypothetical protein ACIQ8G_31195 [Streptomyces sp. NPDC094154]|uniref:hypothetical protein n=1 Tax=unclassified Streptomyces TaxID=2593676 RepID=UPI0037F480E9